MPLNIRMIHVDIIREGFMFNPTNRNAMAIETTSANATGTTASSPIPFQAVN